MNRALPMASYQKDAKIFQKEDVLKKEKRKF
jgi:hypothetical protein